MVLRDASASKNTAIPSQYYQDILHEMNFGLAPLEMWVEWITAWGGPST